MCFQVGEGGGGGGRPLVWSWEREVLSLAFGQIKKALTPATSTAMMLFAQDWRVYVAFSAFLQCLNGRQGLATTSTCTGHHTIIVLP